MSQARERRVATASPALSVALTVALAGCAAGPNFRKPAPPAISALAPGGTPTRAEGSAEGPAQTFVVGADIPGRWWSLFRSPELDALVKAAIANNQDLKAAQAALRQNQELLRAQRGAFLPSLGASLQAVRSRNSATIAPPLADNAVIYNLYTAQVTVTYAPDVFGGVRRQVEGAAARAEAAKDQMEATYLTLTANVVQAALQRASLEEQIEAAQSSVEVERQLTAILKRQLELGQVSGVDLATQESALAQAEAALPPLRKQAAQELDLLSALVGRPPQDAPAEHLRISALSLPREAPLGLPAAVVERRPDVRAAEANLHAASAAIGVAAAARLPALTLTGDLGSAADAVSRLSNSANRFWSLGAGLTQPIFQGGALLHQQRAAEAAYDQAQAQYRGAVLLAFQNVADALQALKEDGAQLDASARADAAATRALAIARRQLEVGEVSPSVLLNAEQAYQQAKLSLIQARTARFTDTVALFQALGAGDWSLAASP